MAQLMHGFSVISKTNSHKNNIYSLPANAAAADDAADDDALSSPIGNYAILDTGAHLHHPTSTPFLSTSRPWI